MSLTTQVSIAEGFSFPVTDINRQLVAADALPTAVLKRIYTAAGVRTLDESAAVVTITPQATAGMYYATWTNGAWAEGDQLHLYATALVATEAYTSLVAVFEVGPSTLANQLTIINLIQDAINGGIAVAELTPGTIVGFPSTLNIGDSYTVDAAASITVYMRDSSNNPITDVGTHSIDDPDFAPTLVITQSGRNSRVEAVVTLVDPGAPESYLRVEIPSEQSRRASAGVATMQCVLKWDGAERTIATQAVTWIPRI